jgi:two-component system response regulator HydG
MTEQTSVLIIDDNAGLCQTMSLILQHKGYAVATAQDGLQAIQRARERAFDFYFLDIKMAPMNGIETQREINQIRPEAVIIMMTAYAVEDLIQEALQQGAYDVIYKPLDVEKLVALIEKAGVAKQSAIVLVVDDDQGTCRTFENILCRRGYQVGIAHSGEQALDMVREQVYDVIFINIQLPAMNGLQTYLAIKAISPATVAVMMTGYRQEVDELMEKALQNNAYACLYKPLDMTEVLGLVDEICGQRGENDGRKRTHLDR